MKIKNNINKNYFINFLLQPLQMNTSGGNNTFISRNPGVKVNLPGATGNLVQKNTTARKHQKTNLVKTRKNMNAGARETRPGERVNLAWRKIPSGHVRRKYYIISSTQFCAMSLRFICR
jgi:hypothetical protein